MSAGNPLVVAGHETGEMEPDDSALWARSVNVVEAAAPPIPARQRATSAQANAVEATIRRCLRRRMAMKPVWLAPFNASTGALGHRQERHLAEALEAAHVAGDDLEPGALVDLARALVELGHVQEHAPRLVALARELEAG